VKDALPDSSSDEVRILKQGMGLVAMSRQVSEEEAKRIMASGLGEAELRCITSITAPLFWVDKQGEKEFKARNGSVFFLDAGEGSFAVTAAHVIQGWRDDCRSENIVTLQVGDLPVDFDGAHAIIASHAAMDIATFRITKREVESLGKTVLTGYQKAWPPRPPDQGKGLYFSGFLGVGRLWMSAREISFGAAPGSGVASSDSEIDVSSQIERENLIAVLGGGVPPENYDFGGISGGPMVAVVEQGGLRS
jgi:hypothetical protein